MRQRVRALLPAPAGIKCLCSGHDVCPRLKKLRQAPPVVHWAVLIMYSSLRGEQWYRASEHDVCAVPLHLTTSADSICDSNVAVPSISCFSSIRPVQNSCQLAATSATSPNRKKGATREEFSKYIVCLVNMNEGTAIGCQLAKSDSRQECFEQPMSVWIIEQSVLLNELNVVPSTATKRATIEGALSGKADQVSINSYSKFSYSVQWLTSW